MDWLWRAIRSALAARFRSRITAESTVSGRQPVVKYAVMHGLPVAASKRSSMALFESSMLNRYRLSPGTPPGGDLRLTWRCFRRFDRGRHRWRGWRRRVRRRFRNRTDFGLSRRLDRWLDGRIHRRSAGIRVLVGTHHRFSGYRFVRAVHLHRSSPHHVLLNYENLEAHESY